MQKVVVVITSLATNEVGTPAVRVVLFRIVTHKVRERWQFDIECDKSINETRYATSAARACTAVLVVCIVRTL